MNIRISYAEIEQAAAALAQSCDEITAKLSSYNSKCNSLSAAVL